MSIESILAYVLVVVFFLAILAFTFYFARSPHPIDAGPEELEVVGKAPTESARESTKKEHSVS